MTLTFTVPGWLLVLFVVAKWAVLAVLVVLAAVGVLFLWAFRGGLYR